MQKKLSIQNTKLSLSKAIVRTKFLSQNPLDVFDPDVPASSK
ncbi:hypothetical protein ACFL1G_04605 [Planctomycetota bacterium]